MCGSQARGLILNQRDRGARCDQRHLLSQVFQREWLQRSPAEVNFHPKNKQLFLKLRHFVRMCQSGHNFQQESQSESFGLFWFVLIMVQYLVLIETELSFLRCKNVLLPPSHFTTFSASYKCTVHNSY